METSYARAIFVAVVLALTVLFAIVAVSKAEAHRISTSQAESIWYSNFNWRCGNGDLWFCGTRNAALQCWATPNAPHRNTCSYQFTEHKLASSNRWCTIDGSLYHTEVWSWHPTPADC